MSGVIARVVGERIYVQRIRETQSKGGILFPQTFKAGKSGHSARLKMNAVRDLFRARVLAKGQCRKCGRERHACDLADVNVGDIVLVYSYADGDGSTLFSGQWFGDEGFLKVGDFIAAPPEGAEVVA